MVDSVTYADLQFKAGTARCKASQILVGPEDVTEDLPGHRTRHRDIKIMRCVIVVLSLFCLLLLIPIGIILKGNSPTREDECISGHGNSPTREDECISGHGQLCLEGWIYLDSACYYFSSEKMDHSNSSDDCRTKNSQLAHVDRHTKSLQAVINATSSEFWVRLDKVNENNTSRSIGNESCVKFAQNIKFVLCDLSFRWICQRNSSWPVCRET